MRIRAELVVVAALVIGVVGLAAIAVPRTSPGSTAIASEVGPSPSSTSDMAETTLNSATDLPSLEASAVPTAPAAPPSSPQPTSRSPQPTRTVAPTPSTGPGWAIVIDDQFNAGGVPSHWGVYDGRYGSGAENCTAPSHVFVSGGSLHLVLSYEASGAGSAGCGPGWYSGGLALDGFSSIDQQVTVRFRVVDSSPGVVGHFIVPMRWPDSDAAWPAAGEEDYCEGDALSGCGTYLHFGSTDQQLSHSYGFDVRNWHTMRVERRAHVVRVFVDSMASPLWAYVGSSTTLPDTLKHVVLQQECRSSCPSGTSGSEDIQIDWITVADPT